MVDEDEILLPLQVHGQRERRSKPFQINVPSGPHGLVQPQSHEAAEGGKRLGW